MTEFEMGERLRALELIYESSPNGVVALDGRGKIFVFNRTAELMTGEKREKYLGRTLDEISGNSRMSRWLSLTRPFQGHTDRIEDRPLSVSCFSLGDIGGGNAWLLLIEDISRLEAVSEELRKVKQLNAEIEAILESSYDELFVVAADGTALRVNNQAAERFYGMKASELIGRNVRDLEREGIFYPRTTDEVLRTKARYDTIQHTITGKVLMVTANPVLDENGNVIKVVSNSRDITELNELRQKLEQSERLNRQYQSEIRKLKDKENFLEDIVASSRDMQKNIDLAEKVAGVDSTVLILGESGVGKDVMARLIHRLSSRREGPFVEINCGAIPETLLESELFGYEPGAFTGARKEGKIGQIEMARGGTLFLDEIAELSLHLQVKLLKVIQDRKLTRVGGSQPMPVDVRIIAATNRDIKKMVEEGKFREDLYYRLNVIPMEISPLRQRREDIAPFIYFFMERLNKRYGMNKKISPGAMDLLLKYSWPGNVRQLENLIERLVVTSDGPEISAEEIPREFHPEQEGESPRVILTGMMSLKDAVAQVEAQLINLALERHKTAEAAGKLLGVHPTTLMRKYKKKK
ncbi:MAG: sigma 54-interacting transcriptional regulator [Bacillota bacterium]